MTKAVTELCHYRADTAVILGSGLGSLVADPKPHRIISYSEFAQIPKPTVQGHAGQFVLGQIGNTKVLFAQGRVHLYEGHTARDVASIIRVLAEAGVKTLVVTNAAGALNPKFKAGNWMMITDQINLTGTSPLRERENSNTGMQSPAAFEMSFLDMTDAYSSRLREKFRAAARKSDIALHEGVYAGCVGPQYETPAEVRMLQNLGADAAGMSTVLEVIQARALGLEVAGFSCLTNLAAGVSREKLSHQEVLEVGRRAATGFTKLLVAAFAEG